VHAARGTLYAQPYGADCSTATACTAAECATKCDDWEERVERERRQAERQRANTAASASAYRE